MFLFNSLLRGAGLDPATVRLIRHRHRREFHRALYHDAIHLLPRFEAYQAGQNNPKVVEQMSSASAIAAFVADPRTETLFVGMWRVKGATPGFLADPYRSSAEPRKDSSVVIDLERMSELSEYRGRIVINWGGGERAWVQYADRQDKQILELRRRPEEIPFPGFARFSCNLDEVDALPSNWLELLRATGGVYLLVHRQSGAQYVGSATGSDGLLGRWRGYADGHGGNKAMRELGYDASEYDVRILETVGSSSTLEEVYDLESLWKEKLGARVQGLNRN